MGDLARERNIEMNLDSFTTNPQITRYTREHIDEHAYQVFPDQLAGMPIDELQRVAKGSSQGDGDRSVYLVLSLDQTKGRVGKGFTRARMQGHLGAVISHRAPGAPFQWSIPRGFVDLIVANDFRLPYVILADKLSDPDALAGEARIREHPDLGDFLINASRKGKHSWSWDEPMHWADIERACLLAGVITDTKISTNFKLHDVLKKQIDAGRIRQIGGKRGPYQLVAEPDQGLSPAGGAA
jgi:phage-related protein